MARQAKILIIEDEQISRDILTNILAESYDVLEATNGLEALDMLERLRGDIACILLDLKMPVMDGFAFLQEKNLRPKLCSIPVIVITQDVDSEAEEKVLKMGVMDFLQKPYKPTLILHKIKNIQMLQKNTKIVQLFTKDSLTGIYNKEAFYQRAGEVLKENNENNESYNIAAFDIEQFKLFNDTYGDKEGDKVLIFVAKKLTELGAEINGVCGRIGNDNFVLLYPRSRMGTGTLVKRLEEDMLLYPLDTKINMKIGIYEVSEKGLPVSGMCDRAFLAANAVKGKFGESYSYYDDSIRQRLQLERHLTNEMQNALSEGQFAVFFQPKYALFDDSVAGAEALVRWVHPQNGFMSPADFIPLFEKNGFITEVDNYVWNQAAELIGRRMRAKLPIVPISVNVSRKDIYNEHLPEIFIEITKNYGIDRRYLHLEITETAYTENPEQLIRVVSKLKREGFVVEMDDFGSGYSSLNMLSELPIDVLKLDMKFIQNETKREKNSNKRNILSFIISLAKWMNLSVVAEGVERESQVELLRNMNCDYVQGYYFARPMPMDEFEELINHANVTDMENEESVDVDRGSIIIRDTEEENVMLLVDDMKMNREILSNIFSDNFAIVEADNGKVALEYIKEHVEEIQIILLDLIMPIMDGYELLKALKKDPALSDIPVVVTSQTGETSEARVLQLGASDFIAKPYHREVAIQRVHNVLADKRLKDLQSKPDGV